RDASEPGARERVDLRSVLQCVVDDAALMGGDAELEDGEDEALVEVDALALQRALTNLLDNALKYGRSARVRLRLEPGEAVMEIADSGPGLPEAELERVFTPFYRSPSARSSDRSGMGLGLSVTRSVLRAHGGDVRLRSAGQGLIAEVRLPLAPDSAAASTVRPRMAEEPDEPPIRALAS
ncbi:MAG: ATP-binding protein, partial [Caulobacteraceae bacterium]|nr:ATP-binding protein [Caulobacteraceae bacterium]